MALIGAHAPGATPLSCPVCDEFADVIAELESDSLDAQELRVGRMACTHCDFVVTDSQVLFSNALLAAQLSKAGVKILQEYGIECPDL